MWHLLSLHDVECGTIYIYMTLIQNNNIQMLASTIPNIKEVIKLLQFVRTNI